MNNLAKSIKRCSGFCVPLILYIVFSLLSIIGVMLRPVQTKIKQNPNSKIILVIVQLIINFSIGGLIYWLCSKCNHAAAWIVFLLPLIFGIIFMAIVFIGFGVIISNKEKEEESEKSIREKRRKRRRRRNN
jgi:hypothetical protein